MYQKVTLQNDSYYGIELGTHAIRISKMSCNEPTNVRFTSGDCAVPSMIYYVNDNQILFGEDAKKKMSFYGSSIHNTNKFFGKEFDDPTIQKDLKSVGYATQKMNNGLVGIFLDSKKKKLVPAHEVTKILLEKAIENSNARNKIKKIVLTVPQSFSENQRELMCTLAKELGLEYVCVIDEPTAAALSCGYGNGKINTFVVFDFGETLDINVMRVTKDVKQEFEILATGGDSHCSESDVDLKLVELVLEKIEDKDIDVEFDDCEDECERIHEQFSSRRGRSKLKMKCHKLKESLSTKNEDTINEDTIFMLYIDEEGDEHTIEIPITREDYITAAEELMNKVINELVNTIDQYKKSKKFKQNIEEVLLVGGGSLIPTLKDRIEQRINLPIRIYKNPINAVVDGAALKGNQLIRQNPKVIDISANKIGIEVMDSVLGIRRVDTLIDKGDTIPCTVTKEFQITKDGQKHIELKLYENTSLPQEKYALGSLTVNLNDLTKKGDKVILHIELQEGGTLKIKATLPNTRIPIEVDDIVELRRKI
ncbi:Heat shock protein 70 [Entamoeba marina]